MPKTLPHNKEAERAVLASMLMDVEATAIALAALRGEDFYLKSHQMIFQAIRDLSQKGITCDWVALSQALQQNGTLGEVGGGATLKAIAGAVATSANIEYHAGIVLEHSKKRLLISTAGGVVERAFDDAPLDESLSALEDLAFLLREDRSTDGFKQIGTGTGKLLDAIEEAKRLAKEGKKYFSGVPTGIDTLDYLLTGNGFQPGDFILIGGRPSTGKTSFAQQIAINAAKEGGIVGIFSIEMSMEAIQKRLLAGLSGLDFRLIWSGELEDSDWRRVTEAANMMTQLPIYLSDSTPNILQVRSWARRLKVQYPNLSMLILDYIGLIDTGTHGQNLNQQITYLSKSLKAIAMDLHVPFVVLSQLSRSSAKENRAPQLYDLRDSGSLEQDADVVVFIHRPDLASSQAEIHLAKQRNGPAGRKIPVVFEKHLTQFKECEETDSDLF